MRCKHIAANCAVIPYDSEAYMHPIAHFLTHQHDPKLIVIAAAICLIASLSTLALMRLSQDSEQAERRRWVNLACLVSGFGIWATHFVAMIGYQTPTAPEYSPSLTLLSLLVAMAGNLVGYRIAARSPTLPTQILAASIVGAGISGMHYLGMNGTEFGGHIVWNTPLVIVSMVLAILPNIAVLRLAFHATGLRSAILATGMMITGTVALHFTGMAAFSVTMTEHSAMPDSLISANTMAMAIGAAALIITSIATIAAGLSARARSHQYVREREFRILVQSISDCSLYMLDRSGHVTSWNVGAERMLGYDANEAIGLHVSRFYPEEDQASDIPAQALAQAEQTGSVHLEAWRTRKDGSRFWAQISIEAIRDASGQLQGYAKITRDVTELKEQQEILRDTTAKLDVALSNMRQGLCLFGPDGNLVLINNRITEIFGVTPQDCPIGTPFRDMVQVSLQNRAQDQVSAEELNAVIERHSQCIEQDGGGTLVVTFADDCTFLITHSPVAGGGWVTTFEDVTERHRAEQKIEFMALHDNLTGLPNRFNFIRQLDKEIQHAKAHNNLIAVVGIDLDGFKEINDFHGHASGDSLLKSIGDRLSSMTGEGECVARFGGDEFAAFKRFNRYEDQTDFVERLASCFKEALSLDEIALLPSASLGVSIYPHDGRNREQIINNADLAMYRAKDTHGTQVCYYEQGMDEAARARRMLANDLRHALEREEFKLAFQVQRNVTTGKITGYEALLRWQHSKHGWVSPDQFIPLAEENGSILAIGEWVLRAACHAATLWSKPWSVAVNLSAIQLTQPNFVQMVEEILQETGLPAARLELEITETAIIADKTKALKTLRHIKALGASIAIDDFGTGYSSLDTLNSFPFDKIKIDKSFLIDSDTNEQSKAIIKAILALGKSLNIPVLAEGLETNSQLNLLQNEGCDLAQGYLWGRPVLQTHPMTEPA